EYPGEGILGVYAISFSQRIEIPEKFCSKTRTQLIDFDRSYNAVTLNGKSTQKQTYCIEYK
ncbi:hypothetical protein, partial [Escherichia coli]|uniref:hypothetical protein n=1 Tax=Escherichia coli TaxID=562 RepID=UPI001BC83AC9